ncbi:MAG: CDP-diacylglycerol--serine O-phosphatidyltransferase [Elusimicrobiota bacterium]|jgi:CDP-diacylglycerol--serine O-phosphatidyltransferase
MKRGIYLFPSILTLSNLAAGMVSVLFASNGHYTSASWAILVGIVMDMMDGRVARWAGATSQFGLELDSLCDAVTFGVAPAVLMYQVALSSMGRSGAAISIFFVMAGVLRLARFNLKAQTGEPSTHFTGLPVPAAAGILASFVLSYELFGNDTIPARTIPAVMHRMPTFYRFVPVMMMLLSVLMVSQVQYGNFKQLKLGSPKSIQTLVVLVGGLLLVFIYPQNMIFVIFCLYVLSGLSRLAVRFYYAQRAKRMAPQKWGRRSTDVGDPGASH